MCGGTIPEVAVPMKKMPVYREVITGRGRKSPMCYVIVPETMFYNVDYATFDPDGESYSIRFHCYKYKKRK